MLNSKMKRSMAWIMTAAVVMTAAPVSAADFSSEADAEVSAEAAEVGEESTVSEENTDAGEENFDSVDISMDDENNTDSEEVTIEDNTENSDETENVFSDGEEVAVQSEDAEEIADDGTMTVEEATSTFAAGAEDNSAPYSGIDKLENGTYTVTANVYVPGEQNKVLKDVNAFLTNPKYPFGTGANYGKPMTPMYYNADLTVNGKDIYVTLELKNPIFQALKIADSSNASIDNITYNDELSTSEIHTKYGKKIQTITFKLNDYSGMYTFENCVEFASALYTEGNSATESEAVWNVPLKLAVDFQGIGKQGTSVTTNFVRSDLGVALVTKKELPEGTTDDIRELTADSTGEDAKVYEEYSKFFEENVLEKERGFRLFYVGLKDTNGQKVENIQKYEPTFYSQASGFFPAFSGMEAQGLVRVENGTLSSISTYFSVGNTVSDLSEFSSENSKWNETYKWEAGEFSGGYIMLYSIQAKMQFKHHMEDTDSGMGIDYYGIYNLGTRIDENNWPSQKDEAEMYYKLITSKNKRGYGDETLETLLKEKSGYAKMNWDTYQLGVYSSMTDPSTYDIIYIDADSYQKMDVELPIEENSDYQIYKIVYDKTDASYTEVEQVTDYKIIDGKAIIPAFTLDESYKSKTATVQRLYGATIDDDSFKGNRAKYTIQYYAIVSEGAVADKPSVSNTTFTYDGTEKSLIPENQYYTVSGDVSKRLPGSYKVTVTLKDGYAWKDGTTDPIEFTWNIKALQTKKPVAVSGLTYNGKNQAGVKAGKGYNLAGTYTAKNVGSYKAKVLLAEGYEWSDGTTDSLTLTWSINKAGQTIKTKVTTKNYTFTSLKKKAASFTIGASGQGTISYKVVKAPSKASKYITVDKKGKVTVKKGAKIGTYVVRVSAAGNSNYKAATKDVTVKVTKLTQKITAKVSGKTYKATSLKKKAAAFSIGAKAKTSVSYKVVKAPSKASKYISVNKSGKVTMKKKAPKGTYEIRVTAKANGTYNAATKTIKVVVK